MAGLRIAWILSCVFVMAWTIASCGAVASPMLRNECELVWSIVLAALGFPVTTVWWISLSAAGSLFSSVGVELGLNPAFDAIAWVGSVVLGYIQWFVFVPWAWRRWVTKDQ